MTSTAVMAGPFTCSIVMQRIRPPQFVREDRDGVTYMTARNYELAFETVLEFTNGGRLAVKARLVGELNQRVVIRDAEGRPVRIGGYVQGRAEIENLDGVMIFRGRYYDSRTIQTLAGDEALTPMGPAVVDHWESGLGEGPYAGHAFSLGGELTREGDGPLRGEARGHID